MRVGALEPLVQHGARKAGRSNEKEIFSGPVSARVSRNYVHFSLCSEEPKPSFSALGIVLELSRRVLEYESDTDERPRSP